MGFGYGAGNGTYHGSKTAHNNDGKRVKTTFDNSMVAHVWAQQTQDFGKSGNGNFYFESRALYSYGSHFVVGYITTDGTALLNDDSYSVSTGQHKSDAFRAVHGRRDYYRVPSLTELARALPWLSNDSKDVRKRGADAIEKHIFQHAAIADEAAAYLLRLAGFKDAAGRVARIKAKAARAAADKKAAEENALRKSRLADARRIAAMTEAEKAEWLSGNSGSRYNLDRAKVRLHHAHKAAKAAKFERQAKAVFDMLKRVRAAIAAAEKKAAIVENNRYVRRTVIPGIRDFAARHAGNGRAMSAYDYQQFAAHAAFLLNHYSARLSAETVARLQETQRQASELHVAVWQEEKRLRHAKEAEKREAWLRGESVPGFYGTDETGGALLRVRGDNLETSQGASVPLSHAIRAFRFIKRVRETGQPWQRNGHTVRVGHFQVDSIDASGNFKAGCHLINWPEVERVAKAIGVFDETASAEALESTHH